jgi:glycosyltransferase involved in cell wall biosynthesis
MTAPQRLLWVNHFALPPGEGGGTRHYDMARQLARFNWTVEIAASDFHYGSRRYIRRAGPGVTEAIREKVGAVELRWLWSAPYEANDWRRGWNWLSFSRSLLRWGRTAARPDVVIGSSPHLLAALAAARLAREWDVPFVFEVRDLWPESIIAAGGRSGFFYQILDGISRHLYRRADRIVCLAGGTAEYLGRERAIERSKLVYIPNGVDPESCPPVERPERDAFTLVYAGAHGAANGLDIVLDAASRLKHRPEIRFILMGDGPAKRDLVRIARERGLSNVKFHEPVPKVRMFDVLAEADAGLMVLRDAPLFSFGVSPNKLFDYFGASLPVVCNVPGEVAGRVRDAGAGEQAYPGSGAALAEAILRLVSRTPQDRAAMGRSARSWVLREHSHPVLAKRLDRTLRELQA